MKKVTNSCLPARAVFASARPVLLSLALVFGLSACSSLGLSSENKYDDKTKQDLYKNGSLMSDTGGYDLLGGKDKKENSGIGVNGFLWRAALDVVGFLPIASADPFGGVITTDWYSAPETPETRMKLNIFIMDRDLRADGVKVSVFRQIKQGPKGAWVDASVAPTTASSIEETILTRARQMRLAQKEFK